MSSTIAFPDNGIGTQKVRSEGGVKRAPAKYKKKEVLSRKFQSLQSSDLEKIGCGQPACVLRIPGRNMQRSSAGQFQRLGAEAWVEAT